MNEDASVNARELGQLCISDTPPSLRQSLAALKALGADWHGLNTPVTSGFVGVNDIDGLVGLCDTELAFQLEKMLLRKGSKLLGDKMKNNEMDQYLPRSELLKQDDLAGGINLGTFVQSCGNKVTSREPRIGVVLEPVKEFTADKG